MSTIDRLRVLAGQRGGGWEIRTPEGLPPTRFPSVRPRPLGESSVGKPTDSAGTADRDCAGCPAWP
jgi:hypothetical protein